MKRAHVWVSGWVQGVFFRAHTRDTALSLGLRGWVKNLPDGRVEAVFEGEDDALNKMVSWCHKGPAAARVDDVEVEWEEPTGEFEDFSIAYW